MIGGPGDRIVVESERVGQHARQGEIVTVEEGATGFRYRVRWEDGHDSVFVPESGNAQIIANERS